eukprot:PLAT5401.1.p1 GENE.PLAT5401.1~~PLAT5401.1.p1  ORF type:complete len:932 (+),score=249.16 PLAT5401.1:413-2797(+)
MYKKLRARRARRRAAASSDSRPPSSSSSVRSSSPVSLTVPAGMSSRASTASSRPASRRGTSEVLAVGLGGTSPRRSDGGRRRPPSFKEAAPFKTTVTSSLSPSSSSSPSPAAGQRGERGRGVVEDGFVTASDFGFVEDKPKRASSTADVASSAALAATGASSSSPASPSSSPTATAAAAASKRLRRPRPMARVSSSMRPSSSDWRGRHSSRRHRMTDDYDDDYDDSSRYGDEDDRVSGGDRADYDSVPGSASRRAHGKSSSTTSSKRMLRRKERTSSGGGSSGSGAAGGTASRPVVGSILSRDDAEEMSWKASQREATRRREDRLARLEREEAELLAMGDDDLGIMTPSEAAPPRAAAAKTLGKPPVSPSKAMRPSESKDSRTGGRHRDSGRGGGSGSGGSSADSRARGLAGAAASRTPAPEGTRLSLTQAAALRLAVFGRRPDGAIRSFSDSWMKQGFCFSQLDGLRYGIVQHDGGPCGVLAAVQAVVLKELLFNDERGGGDDDWNEPSEERVQLALLNAVMQLLWAAGDSNHCSICMKGPRGVSGRRKDCKPDGLTERLVVYDFSSLPAATDFLRSRLHLWMEEYGSGVTLFTYSLLLSRGIDGVRGDVDSPFGELPPLIDRHNYATQEMVNLLLCGRAHSNVFNGSRAMDGDDGSSVSLRGIPAQSSIGFLTLFEKYGYVEVGSFLKTPRYPIWIVCSESHYSVFFCRTMSVLQESKADEPFDIYYWDGLGMQEEEVRLTVTPSPMMPLSPCERGTCDKERCHCLISPLEFCLRTKWSDGKVNWNGSDPIL